MNENKTISSLSVALGSEQAAIDFGQTLAALVPAGSTVHLRGELGAGKTTLTRGIARGLGHRGAVKSPTYTLVEPYLELTKPLYHFDLYRLGDPEELEFMGIRDYFDSGALVVIEWPERGGAFLPAPDLEITLQVVGEGRSARVQAHSDVGLACVNALATGR